MSYPNILIMQAVLCKQLAQKQDQNLIIVSQFCELWQEVWLYENC